MKQTRFLSPAQYMGLFQVFNQAVYSGARFLVAVYAIHLGASPFTVGLLTSLFSIVPSMLTVSAGKLIDRIGTKVPLNVAQGAMCLLSAVICLWPRQDLLYVYASLLGVMFFVVFIGVNSLINHYSTPDTRAANFSLMSTGISVAQGGAPLVLGLCADTLGYVAAFVLVALFPVMSWGVFAVSGLAHIKGRDAAKKAERHGSTYGMLRDAKLRPIFLTGMLFTVSWGTFLSLTPIYGHQIGLSASQMGMMMMAYSVATFLVRSFAPWLTRRYTHWQILLGAMVVAAGGSMGYGLSGWLPLMFFFAAIQGAGQGLGGPMTTAALYDVAPKGRGSEAISLRLSLGTATQSCMPMLAGGLSTVLPAGLIFVGSGLILLAGAWFGRGQWHAPRPRGH